MSHKLSTSVMNGPSKDYQTFIGAFIVLSFTVILTFGRAYNTHDMEHWLRALMWLTITGLIVSQCLILHITLRQLLEKYKAVRPLSVALALLFTTLLVALEVELLKYTPLVPKAHDSYLKFVVFMSPLVVMVGGLSLSLTTWIKTISANTSPASSSASILKTNSVPIDDWPRGKVLLIHAQEHYLSIRTDSQQKLVRGRMKDADIKLKNEDGLIIHRSWWIHKDNVAKIARDGRDYRLTSICGREIPIARSRLQSLRAKQWI